MSSSVTNVLPALRTDSVPGPNIMFLDWNDATMTLANSLCASWVDTGATSVVASDRAWESDPRNILDAAAGTFHDRTTYVAPTRDPGDTTAVRVIHDRDEKKRDDFMSASREIKIAMMDSLGTGLCEAAAASTVQGRMKYMTPRHLYEWVEAQFGLLILRT